MKFKKQILVLGIVSLLTDISSEMLYPIMPVFMTAVLGASMTLVGLLEGIAEFTAGLLKGYSGLLSDRLKKRSLFVSAGYSLSALSKPLPGIFPTIFTVIFSRITDRIGKGIRTAPRDALLASYSDGKTGEVFGFHRAMDTLGAAIGPIIALIILAIYNNNYTLVFLIAFIPAVIASVITFFVKDNPNELGKITKSKIRYISFYKDAPVEYRRLLWLLVIFAFANSSDVFLILRAGNVNGSGTTPIIAYIMYNLVYAIASYPLGRLADKFGKKNIFTAGLLIFSFVYFGFGIAPNIYYIFGLFILYGIYAAATEGISKAWVSDLIDSAQRGTAIGLLTMLVSFSSMLGSFFAGLLWDTFTPETMFYFSGIVSSGCFIYLLIKNPSR